MTTMDERRRAFDTVGNYLRAYWPLLLTMFAALGSYFKTSYLVENLAQRVAELEVYNRAHQVEYQKVKMDGAAQSGTIMVIDERTRRMAEDIRDLRDRKK